MGAAVPSGDFRADQSPLGRQRTHERSLTFSSNVAPPGGMRNSPGKPPQKVGKSSDESRVSADIRTATALENLNSELLHGRYTRRGSHIFKHMSAVTHQPLVGRSQLGPTWLMPLISPSARRSLDGVLSTTLVSLSGSCPPASVGGGDEVFSCCKPIPVC